MFAGLLYYTFYILHPKGCIYISPRLIAADADAAPPNAAMRAVRNFHRKLMSNFFVSFVIT